MCLSGGFLGVSGIGVSWNICLITYLQLQGRALLKRTEDGQTAGPLFKTLYGMHAIPLAFALLLQLGYNAQQFAGPLLLKKITTFLTNSAYIQQVLFRYCNLSGRFYNCLVCPLVVLPSAALCAHCLHFCRIPMSTSTTCGQRSCLFAP